ARKRKDCQRIGSADRPLPSRSGRHLDYESFRLAESQQILPLIGNRKPASDRGHWLQPAPCSSRRRSCPGGERGDRQFSPSGSNPSRARIGGYDYKTESFQRPRAEHYTRFREIRNSNFLVPPPLGVGVFGKLPAARKRKDRQRNRLGRSQHAPASQEPKACWRSGRQIEPLPSRSGRLLDYESSGSPSPSRSYR